MRWQYAIVNIGSFGAVGRLTGTLGKLGAEGWELVHVYDKASNWFQGMEKGFVLFKRLVLAGQEPEGGQWAVQLDATGSTSGELREPKKKLPVWQALVNPGQTEP